MDKPFVVLNVDAGSVDRVAVRRAIERHFGAADLRYQIFESAEFPRIAHEVQSARERGFDTLLVAGGDGTVSVVAAALAQSQTPIGIIPVGTLNGLACALGLPNDFDGALRLFTGAHALRMIDALRVADRVCLMGVSAGVSAQIIGDTESDLKHRLGRFAYILQGIDKISRPPSHAFDITVDGQHHHLIAAEALVMNAQARTLLRALWRASGQPDQGIDDGEVEVYALQGRTGLELLRGIVDVLVAPSQSHRPSLVWTARRRVAIRCEPAAEVEGDGDVIGHTPIEVEVLPDALSVIVPS